MRQTRSTDCEHAQTSEQLIEDARHRIGAPYNPHLFNVMSESPILLHAFLGPLDCALDLGLIRSAANCFSRTAANYAKTADGLPDDLEWLRQHGYGREDMRQIRYVIEVFYNLEPVLAIVTAVALRWLSGAVGGFVVRTDICAGTRAECRGPVVLVAEEDIPSSLAEDVRSGTRPIHPIFRALSIWPSYVEKAWKDIRCGGLPDFASQAASLSSLAVELAIPITEPLAGLPPSSVPQGMREVLSEDLLESARATLIACVLRRGFIASELRARRKHTRIAG